MNVIRKVMVTCGTYKESYCSKVPGVESEMDKEEENIPINESNTEKDAFLTAGDHEKGHMLSNLIDSMKKPTGLFPVRNVSVSSHRTTTSSKSSSRTVRM